MRKCLAVNIDNHFNTVSHKLSSLPKLLVQRLLEKHVEWRERVASDIPSVQLTYGAQHLLQEDCVPLHSAFCPCTSKGLIVRLPSQDYYRYLIIVLSVVGRSLHTCAGMAEAHSHPEPVSVPCRAAQLWHTTDKVQHSICHGTTHIRHSIAYVMAQAGNLDFTHTLVADLLTTRAELAPEASISICN